jgi:hypothetical protein
VKRRSSDNISTQASKHYNTLRGSCTTYLFIWKKFEKIREEREWRGRREKGEQFPNLKPRERKIVEK